MDILNQEVFMVLTAIVLIGSLIALFEMNLGWSREHYIALSLLDERCLMGGYPRRLFVDMNVTLCIEIYDNLGYPVYAKIVYKIAGNNTLPTHDKPSPEKDIKEYKLLVDNGETIRLKINVSVPREYAYRRIALVFELWIYDPEAEEWVYTGRWLHLYVHVVGVPV